MLIRLHITEGDIAHLTGTEISALENIGTIAFFGFHVIAGRRATLNALAADARFSARVRAVFTAAVSRAAEMEAIDRLVERRLDVSNTYLEARQIESGWEVPLSALSNSAILSAPVILAENLVDAQFFRELGRWYGWHSRVRSLSFYCTAAGGGGSTLYAELHARVLNEGAPTFCIVDSDRAYPSGPIGETARKCQTELPSDLWYARLCVLACREAENVLPPDWIRQTETGRQATAVLETLQRLNELDASFLLSFADLKNGVTACELVNATNEFVRESVRNDLAKISVLNERIAVCHRHAACGHESPCFSLPGIGHTILAQVSVWLSSASSNATLNVIKSDRLLPLARAVFEWGVALPKMRV